ncbi:hypothetical protein [Spiroplasma sp. AdecLV25b]|uniref:hypothetical protein n=1 Tax=Spiroplasma sp. AdecLV25b TaxID=3027162 RepID=UPI0027E0AAF0|nr:hypothetical protein [Spiroplasma sp. AdecLV25b]
MPNKEIFIIPKKIVKKSSVSNKKEPDFLIIQKTSDVLNIIEIKDGWVFDTKKAAGEYQQLKDFQNEISKVISYKIKIFMCNFNNNNKVNIFNGFKKKIPLEHIMTGAEFCHLVNISYEEISNERNKEGNQNFQYFIQQLLLIDEVKIEIQTLLLPKN